jgi:hypothetical protein
MAALLRWWRRILGEAGKTQGQAWCRTPTSPQLRRDRRIVQPAQDRQVLVVFCTNECDNFREVAQDPPFTVHIAARPGYV